MKIWLQLALAAAVGAVGVVAVAHLVPAARPMLQQAGVWPLLERSGLAPAVAAESAAAPRGPGMAGVGIVPEVLAHAPQHLPISSDVAAIGTGMALRAVAVRPEVAGRLAEMLIASGDRVEAGQVIARLEAAAEAIALTRAGLVLADARAGFDRVQGLSRAGTVTDLQRSTAELSLRQAELALQQAEYELSRRVILAPISGLAGIVEFGIGDQLTTADLLTRIDDRSEILIDFTVPERFVGRVLTGSPVQAIPLARPELAITGSVVAIENRVDITTRSIRMQASIPNEGDLLRAGMAFSIRLSFTGDTYPAVDPLAIQWASDGAYVWLLREGRALRQPVQIVQRTAQAVLLRVEFQPGDLVVTEGVQALRPGGEARLREAAASAPVSASPPASASEAAPGATPAAAGSPAAPDQPQQG